MSMTPFGGLGTLQLLSFDFEGSANVIQHLTRSSQKWLHLLTSRARPSPSEPIRQPRVRDLSQDLLFVARSVQPCAKVNPWSHFWSLSFEANDYVLVSTLGETYCSPMWELCVPLIPSCEKINNIYF